MKTLKRSIVVVIALLTASTVHAQNVIGTRAAGMGGAVRASAAGGGAVLVNPAAIGLSKMYSISAQYQFRSADSSSVVTGAIVDSTRRISAGLYYNYVRSNPQFTLAIPGGGSTAVGQTLNTHETGLALAMALGKNFALGVTTRYLNHKGSFDNEGISLALPEASNVTVDVGLSARWSGLRFAAVGYNLAPVHDQLFPTQLGLGVAYSFKNFLTLGFDSILDFTTDPDAMSTTIQGGAELFLAKRYAVRAGVSHGFFRDATYVTAGLGIITRHLGVEGALRQQAGGGAETQVAISVQFFR